MASIYQTSLDILIQTRVNFKKLIKSLDEKDLYVIPDGFNNNIIWNYGHNIISQQGLIYKMAGLETQVDSDLVSEFGKGSKPDGKIVEGLKDRLILLSFSTLEQLQKDILTPEIFENYKSYMTSYGYELTNINEALLFNSMHESLHFGYAMAQKRALKG